MLNLFRRGREEALLDTEFEPSNQVDVDFEPSIVNPNVIVSTHVDTIQVLLLELQKSPELDLHVKGRVADSPVLIDEITGDSMFQLFTSLRANDRARIFTRLSNDSGIPLNKPHLHVGYNGTEEGFATKFYSGRELVDDWTQGKTNPIKLLPIFGGATILTFGSDVASVEEITEFGRYFRYEVWDKQINGTSVRVEQQKARDEQLRRQAAHLLDLYRRDRKSLFINNTYTDKNNINVYKY